MSSNIRLYNSDVKGMKNLFDKKVEEHKTSQMENPFSEWENSYKKCRRLSKDDQFYGRPLPGSKSEAKAQAAQYHVMMDIKYLCEMIWDCAEWRSPDGRAAMTFGKLFNLYNAISDKVVGTLLRARKHGFLQFEGEMLYQRRDEDKIIELTRNINTIRKRFGLAPLVTGGGEVEPWSYDNADDIPYHILKERRKTSSVIDVTKTHIKKSENRKASLDFECHGGLPDISKIEDEDNIDKDTIHDDTIGENTVDKNAFDEETRDDTIYKGIIYEDCIYEDTIHENIVDESSTDKNNLDEDTTNEIITDGIPET